MEYFVNITPDSIWIFPISVICSYQYVVCHQFCSTLERLVTREGWQQYLPWFVHLTAVMSPYICQMTFGYDGISALSSSTQCSVLLETLIRKTLSLILLQPLWVLRRNINWVLVTRPSLLRQSWCRNHNNVRHTSDNTHLTMAQYKSYKCQLSL